jgi:hypothetical protein
MMTMVSKAGRAGIRAIEGHTMTAPTATQPATVSGSPAKAGAGKANQPVVTIRPFVVGTRDIDKQDYNQTASFTSGTHFPTYQISPNGFFSGLTVMVSVAASANAATVTYAQNGPFNAIQLFQLSDVNNKPIVGPMNGWDLAVPVNKYGGYYDNPGADPRQSPFFTAVAGAGGTGGSFTFAIDVPVEVRRRDGMGSLYNSSASSTYSVDIYSEAPANVYGTAPTTVPTTMNIIIQLWGRSDPTQTDKLGNPVAQTPPASGTIQYWQKQSYGGLQGAFDFRLQGIDNFVRNLVFVLVDSTGSRSQGESDWPTPFLFQYETLQTMARSKSYWRHRIFNWFGYTGTLEAAGAADNGVFPLIFDRDWTSSAGNETGLTYLPVSTATNLELTGTIGGSGAHTLYVYVNKIVPYGNVLDMTGR